MDMNMNNTLKKMDDIMNVYQKSVDTWCSSVKEGIVDKNKQEAEKNDLFDALMRKTKSHTIVGCIIGIILGIMCVYAGIVLSADTINEPFKNILNSRMVYDFTSYIGISPSDLLAALKSICALSGIAISVICATCLLCIKRVTDTVRREYTLKKWK